MRTLVLMDSFKGSLTSTEAGEAVREGILDMDVSQEVSVYPFADGGEGTLEAFLSADNKSRKYMVAVCNPLGRVINAEYGVLSGGTVIIESAKACGLNLIGITEREPLCATTYGLGELIKDAIGRGYREYIIGIGGSATNDCGLGMLSALGFEFLDKDNAPVAKSAEGLGNVAHIVTYNAIPELKDCSFTIACDVRNPLYGRDGATYVYARQKGAKDIDLPVMDSAMKSFSDAVKATYKDADPHAEGAGAAGGLGFAFKSFLNAKMRPGAELLIQETDIENRIKDADIIITGEGCMDSQTAMGKAPARIATIAKKYGKKVIAIVGTVGKDYEKCYAAGIDVIIPTVAEDGDIIAAMDKDVAKANISRIAAKMAAEYIM